MVEHITDAAVLADIDATIATLAKNRQGLPRSFSTANSAITSVASCIVICGTTKYISD